MQATTLWLKRVLTVYLLGLAAACWAAPFTFTVDGKIAKTNQSGRQAYVFSEAALMALPQHTIRTSTSWTPVATFTGPRLSDVLKAVGAHGKQIEFRCIDEYTFTIPASDADRYGVILARTMNGKVLGNDNYGPLWIMYPRDQFPDELKTPLGEAKFAWQVVGLTVK
ncbi:molybdopterin-dependent oxidoreductase [Burkholderia multivorans]|uniref:Oxidoreductase molybdopterin-binding domain-containing protein n=1 Tax=Burkholderia multivorans (strain ATCC 17616 / 249) TaxID=395019 RepID=A0A0H3KIZ2_BURM1|nr:molybdopterin-dependent oxidoreductase [Burkholderia multivorans]KGB90424.1 oxidoreductase molybdopterin binding domain protein [Burkholderia multivorans]KVQ73331.1 oxidoreductase [Burkholderia multivorans]KVV17026.1 oxidoreductase [Burkholderia multivorans]MBU9143342.1 molybdopterin-dependent oxidoreductase [Burkholderia multivorans]MBU9181763.1 molybdopterin-dependent oxidoreductase [Burkholderia multivorans]